MRKISLGKISLLIGGLLLVLSLAHANSFAEVQQTYQNATFVQAEFQQARQVKFISKPLVSNGELVFAREQGLIWQINTPFFSSLFYRSNGDILQTDEQGKRTKADPDVMAKAMTKIIDDVLSGAWDLLDEKFTVVDEVVLDAGQKQVQLKPTDQLVAKVVTGLTIRFSELINELEFSDADGNVTTLTFYNQTAQQTALSDAELAKFK